MSKKAFDVNRQTWNEKVKVHAESDMYDLKAFKKGKSSLMPYELNAIGDVQGKSLLHLQCHFGQDTLSWSRWEPTALVSILVMRALAWQKL